MLDFFFTKFLCRKAVIKYGYLTGKMPREEEKHEYRGPRPPFQQPIFKANHRFVAEQVAVPETVWAGALGV
jgi:hypothetical protein